MAIQESVGERDRFCSFEPATTEAPAEGGNTATGADEREMRLASRPILLIANIAVVERDDVTKEQQEPKKRWGWITGKRGGIYN